MSVAFEVIVKVLEMKIKEFTKEEMYERLKYLMYCKMYEIEVKVCESYHQYQKFLIGASFHMGDCTKESGSCLRCQLNEIEIEAQNALDMLWNDPVGHCGRICLKECEGPKK